jgi:MFS transporter, YNFM family, putative membrane transport protein
MDTPRPSFVGRHAEISGTGALRPFAGVFAIAICGVCAFLDMYCTQPLLPLFVQLLHASKAAAGLTVSATTLGVAIAAPFVGSYVERYNRKKIIVGSIFALVIPTVLAATSRGLLELVFWRFLQGTLMPGIFATTIAYIAEEWAETKVALLMAIYVSGTVLGGFLGRFLTGVIADHFGWQWAFLFLGFATAAGGVLVAACLPQARHGGRIKGQDRSAQMKEHHMLALLRHFRNTDLLVTFGIGFNILFALVSIFTYVTFHLAAPPYRLSTSALSLLFAVYLVGLIATPAGGYLLTRIGLRKGVLGAVALSLAGVLLTLAPSLWIIIVGLTLCSSGVFISQAAAITYLREAAPAGARVSAAGLYLSCYYIGGTVAGIAPGYLWRFGEWTACVMLTVAVQLLTIGLIVFGWRNRTAARFVEPA